jgi:hypothetical protein
MSFVHRAGDPFTAALTGAVGQRLTVRLEPARGYVWSTVESDAPAVAQVAESAAAPDGSATATVILHAVGTAALTATTSYRPDPNGPPTRRWRLVVTVAQANG